MSWVETASESFAARHAERDAGDAERVLETLEAARERLEPLFPRPAGDVTVVLHDSRLALAAAQPVLPLAWALSAPAGRRYLAGWFTRREIHVLAPRELAVRASNVEGSLETLMLAPVALYVQMLLGAANPELPPSFTPGTLVRAARWAWLLLGAGQLFSGQTEHARAAIARRLRDGGRPAFPPGVRDAALLGGTVLDLLRREEGTPAVARLITRLHPDGPRAALERAFGGRALVHTEGAWRSHLARLAEPGGRRPVS